MFRISRYMRELVRTPGPPIATRPDGAPAPGPVVIWNLVRRCNLTCKHCYSISADIDYPGELSTAEVFTVLDDLAGCRVPALILSGGEPLLRTDLFEIAARARELGLYVALSTNGTMVDDAMSRRIAGARFDYVGISLDGRPERHDRFRRKAGAFEAALGGLRRLRDVGVKVGVRMTQHQDNGDDLGWLLDLCEAERFDKFYLSHLNYGGRGNIHRRLDAAFDATRRALDLLFDRAFRAAVDGEEREYVTGNNDADGVYLLRWVQANFPREAPRIRESLVRWGGNASGVGIGNIDNLGRVHPDTFWWHHTIGNVRERPFSAIWADTTDPLMAGLKQRPRPLEGRCGRCVHRDICGGNTRTRAQQLTGNPWAEDPGCYLDDDEIGLRAPTRALPCEADDPPAPRPFPVPVHAEVR